MPVLLARKQYCHKCKKGYDKITDHPCGDLCKLCHIQNCPIVQWTYCQDWNRFFKSDECFVRHKDATGQKKALGTSLTKCQRCRRVITRASINDHHCGLVRCTVCQKYFKPENHQCYMQPIEARKLRRAREDTNNEFLDDVVAVDNDVDDTIEREQSLMLFDFECTQDEGNTSRTIAWSKTKAATSLCFLGTVPKTSPVRGSSKKRTPARPSSPIISRLTMGTLSSSISTRMALLPKWLLVAQRILSNVSIRSVWFTCVWRISPRPSASQN